MQADFGDFLPRKAEKLKGSNLIRRSEMEIK